MERLFFSVVSMDSAEPWQATFQDPASPVMEGIIDLHHDIMFIIVIIVVAVGWVMGRTLQYFSVSNNPVPATWTHGTTLEIIWTVTPSLILMVIAVPSFALLYAVDELKESSLTLKVVGHQWYWSYEYSDYTDADGESIEFDAYMIPEEDLEAGQLRLLEVDNRVVLPVHTHIRVLLTSTDVIHCWGIPSLAMKLDAIPGRLNQVSLYINREGVFYGQCSEICGVNHGFMPIVVEGVSVEKYIEWVKEQEVASTWLESRSSEIAALLS